MKRELDDQARGGHRERVAEDQVPGVGAAPKEIDINDRVARRQCLNVEPSVGKGVQPGRHHCPVSRDAHQTLARRNSVKDGLRINEIHGFIKAPLIEILVVLSYYLFGCHRLSWGAAILPQWPASGRSLRQRAVKGA